MDTTGSLVAIRFRDKRLIKGRTADFRPGGDFFHVRRDGISKAARVPMRDLKAIFFIKTLGRDPQCVDRKTFGDRAGPEKKVWLEFADGERLAGWSNSCGPRQTGFFVFPSDPDSNMERAYVFRSALRRLEEGVAAEEASRAYCMSAEAAWTTRSAPGDVVGSYRLVRRPATRRR